MAVSPAEKARLTREVLQRVANWNGLGEDTWYGCTFCSAGSHGTTGRAENGDEDPGPHEADCIISQARRALGRI